MVVVTVASPAGGAAEPPGRAGLLVCGYNGQVEAEQ